MRPHQLNFQDYDWQQKIRWQLASGFFVAEVQSLRALLAHHALGEHALRSLPPHGVHARRQGAPVQGAGAHTASMVVRTTWPRAFSTRSGAAAARAPRSSKSQRNPAAAAYSGFLVSVPALPSGCRDATLRVWTLNGLMGTARSRRREGSRLYMVYTILETAV